MQQIWSDMWDHDMSIKNVPTRYVMMIQKVENKLKDKKKCAELAETPTKTGKQYSDEAIPCLICEKTFLHKGALTMHGKTHAI